VPSEDEAPDAAMRKTAAEFDQGKGKRLATADPLAEDLNL
jgi:hypothetical protein